MKAISLVEPRRFEQIEIEEPQAPAAGEALVRVHRVGICGTDISGYLGKMPFFRYPVIPGHELGVEVLEVGAGVTNVRPGDRCSVEPYLNNPDSFASRHGHGNCCEDLQVLGVHRDGGLREAFALPARKLHKSRTLSMEQLALVETLAIGCHAVDRGGLSEGEQALVIGAGPIGLSIIEFLKLAGAVITVLDLNEQRLRFCRHTMGADHTVTLSPDGSHAQQLAQITQGHGFTCVLDATGSNTSMSSALKYVAHTGRLVFLGITTGEIRFLHPLMHRKEATLLASRNALPDDFQRIIRFLEEGHIDTRPWITHRTSFEALIQHFPSYTLPETGVIKAIVELD